MIAITRDVSPSLARCELSFVQRSAIDIERAVAQHTHYCRTLRMLGCDVIALPALEDMPDAVFVEDVAVVLDEVAVMTHPGAVSRRQEGESVAAALRAFRTFRTVRTIDGDATIDGGDVLRVDRTLFVGQGARTNAAGIARLREIAEPLGYRVQGVPTHGCLHLKSAATLVADGTLLVQPAWVDVAVFGGLRQVIVDPEEEHAANALRVGAGVVHPACFPRTRQRLQDAGIDVVAVDLSELQKAEGATTCCSIVFARDASGSVQ
ncbi:dimethylarginine dimethylaminohydrolase family protein [Cognatiluteimonas profundi]|uniref:dimethylarginine dimethylaminohydrolase family protein n=1 Tax=Cognatiluteimonas profundi TaxID=2594501 RepID=UPI00131C714C|nr:arginine deiminase family protein [Lysobacter profundi]